MKEEVIIDRTVARTVGVQVARLLHDGMSPDQIAEWVRGIAHEIDIAEDDSLICGQCGQVVDG